MIGPLISWQCKNGAAHRKNFDTPPLEGSLQSAFSALGVLLDLKRFVEYGALYGAPVLPE